MRYIKDGVILCVELAGVGENGQMFQVFRGEHPIIDIPSSSNREEVEKAAKEYADEHGYELEVIYNIRQGKRVLQGNEIEANDFITLSPEQVEEDAKKYFGHKSRVAELEAELKQEIEDLKKDYKERIGAEEEAMAALEHNIRMGTKKEECAASWKRDVTNGIKVLVRRDNLKVLQVQVLPEAERQVEITDQEAHEGYGEQD